MRAWAPAGARGAAQAAKLMAGRVGLVGRAQLSLQKPRSTWPDERDRARVQLATVLAGCVITSMLHPSALSSLLVPALSLSLFTEGPRAETLRGHLSWRST